MSTQASSSADRLARVVANRSPSRLGATVVVTRRAGWPASRNEVAIDAASSTAHSPSSTAAGRRMFPDSCQCGSSERSSSTVTGRTPALSSARTMSWPRRAALAQWTRRGSSPATYSRSTESSVDCRRAPVAEWSTSPTARVRTASSTVRGHTGTCVGLPSGWVARTRPNTSVRVVSSGPSDQRPRRIGVSE